MANLKEIRSRISSVQSTMQITSAMKMVSAAKLKKAQDAITAMRPYAEKLTELLQNLSATLDRDTGGAYTEQREVKKVLLVAITSNRGLCGAFNTNVLKEVKSRTDLYAGKQVDVYAIGKKASDNLKKTHTVIGSNNAIFDHLSYDNAALIADEITQRFLMTAMHKATDNASELQKSLKLSYNKARQAAITNEILEIVGGAEALNG